MLNPVSDVFGITSFSDTDASRSQRSEELGSKFKRDNPNWEEELAKRSNELFGKSPWKKGSGMDQRMLRRSMQAQGIDTSQPGIEQKLNRMEELEFERAQTRRNLQMNFQNRDFDINGGGVFDTVHVQTLKPLEIAKLHFNLTVLPDLMLYNDHFEIKILDQDDVPFELPVYFSVENNYVTNKRAHLIIRIFNWT